MLGFGFLRITPRIMIQKMAICQVGSRWVDVQRASTVTCLRDGGRNWERVFGGNICPQPCDCAGLQFHNGQWIFYRKRFSCITEMVMCHSNYRPCAVKKPPISDVPSFSKSKNIMTICHSLIDGLESNITNTATTLMTHDEHEHSAKRCALPKGNWTMKPTELPLLIQLLPLGQ